jgi:hypothetical protein
MNLQAILRVGGKWCGVFHANRANGSILGTNCVEYKKCMVRNPLEMLILCYQARKPAEWHSSSLWARPTTLTPL